MKPMTVAGFKGMDNVHTEKGFVGHDDGSMTAIPSVILNADVTPDSRLKKRAGYALFFALPNSHSAWSTRRVMLVAAEGHLYRFFPDGTKITLCNLAGPHEEKLFYAAVDNEVYISSRHWMGILDITTNQVRAWGIQVPEQPVMSLQTGTGALKSGTYHVCYTLLNGGMVGGNGMSEAIEVLVDDSTILLLNRPANIVVWITDPNGNKFYRALAEQDRITGVDTLEPLPTFMCSPPNPMRFIRKAFGRMWGAIDNELLYSEPYRLDLYKSTNRFTFPTEIKMVGYVDGGIYVGFEERTIFLPGTEPTAMKEVDVGSGVTRNILAYCNNIPGVGNNVPVWVSIDGLVAGGHSGALLRIKQDMIQFPAGREGAAISRTINGQAQFLASFKQERPSGSGVGFGDSATCDVVRNGSVL
jgi:hypothetical protein